MRYIWVVPTRPKQRLVGLLGALAVAILSVGAGPAVWSAPMQGRAPAIDYVVVGAFPHDEEAFTEGLDFWRGRFFESTGLNGRSTMREVELTTGEVIRSRALADRHFGEGMTILGRRAYWLTWRSGVAFVYRARDFARLGRFTYRGEGWGLTHDGTHLVMSNGSSTLTFRRPDDFRVVRRLYVTDGGEDAGPLNELEWVNGSIFANVWPTDDVVRIDPTIGAVTGRLDLSRLYTMEAATREVAETNGIAYLPAEDRFFVTGKYWANVYELELEG